MEVPGGGVSPLSASTASPSSAGSRITGCWFSTPVTLPKDGPQPASNSAGGAPWELWARTFAYLSDPAAFAASCRLFKLVARDPVLRSQWLVGRFGERGAFRAMLWTHSRLFTPALGKALISALRRRHKNENLIPRWWLQCALRGLIAGRAGYLIPTPGNAIMAEAGNQAEMGIGTEDEESPVVLAPPTPNNTPVDGVPANAMMGFNATLPNFLPMLPDSPVPGLIAMSPILSTRTNVDGSKPILIPLPSKQATSMLTFLVVLSEELFGKKADLTGDDLAELAEAHGLNEAALRMRTEPNSFTWPLRTDEDLVSPMDEVDEDDFADPVEPPVPEQAAGQQAVPEAANGAITLDASAPKTTSPRKLFLKYALSPLYFGRLPLLPIHPLPSLPMVSPGRLAESPDLLLRTWNPLFETALKDPKLFAAIIEGSVPDFEQDVDGKAIYAELVGRLVLHARWRADPGPAVSKVLFEHAIVRPIRAMEGTPRGKTLIVSAGQIAWMLERVDLFDGELCAPACAVVVDLCRKQELAMGKLPGDGLLTSAALIFLRENPTSLFAFFERFRNHFTSPKDMLQALFADEVVRRGATRNRFVTPWQVCRKLSTYVTVWDGIKKVIGDFIDDRSTIIRMLEGLWPFADKSRLQSHAELFQLADLNFTDALVTYSGSSAFLRTDSKSHPVILNERWAPFLGPRRADRCIRNLLEEMQAAVDDFASAARKDCKEEPVSPGACLCGESSALFWHTLSYPFEWLLNDYPALGRTIVGVQIAAVSAACGSSKLRSANGDALAMLGRCAAVLESRGESAADTELLDFVRGTKVSFPEDREFLKLFFELCRQRVKSAGPDEREDWRNKALRLAKDGRSGREYRDALGYHWWLSNILLPEIS